MSSPRIEWKFQKGTSLVLLYYGNELTGTRLPPPQPLQASPWGVFSLSVGCPPTPLLSPQSPTRTASSSRPPTSASAR